jgi:Protein of unknown function (DUF3617)
MRPRLILAFILLAPLVLLAADKLTMLNLKEGLWEITVSGMPGVPDDMLAKLPPEQRAQMEAMMKQRGMSSSGNTTVAKTCITKEKLDKGVAFSTENRQNCTRNVVSSSPTHAEVKVHCEENKSSGNKSTVDSTTVIDVVGPDSTKGSTHAVTNSNGRNMVVDLTFTSKYLGAACGDIK